MKVIVHIELTDEERKTFAANTGHKGHASRDDVREFCEQQVKNVLAGKTSSPVQQTNSSEETNGYKYNPRDYPIDLLEKYLYDLNRSLPPLFKSLRACNEAPLACEVENTLVIAIPETLKAIRSMRPAGTYGLLSPAKSTAGIKSEEATVVKKKILVKVKRSKS